MQTRGEIVNCSNICSCRLITKAKDWQEICCTTSTVTHQSKTLINTIRELPPVCPVNNLHHSLSITQPFNSILTLCYLLIQESWGLCSVYSCDECWCMGNPTGFVQIMENLESHGVLQFRFPGLESPEIQVWVMESHGKSVCFL